MTAIDRRAAIAGTAAAILAGLAPSAADETLRVEMQPDLGDLFTDADTTGTFAVLDVAGGRIVVTDRERAEAGFLPASTFKIPNSLIALETGVVADADSTMFPWDKVVRDFDAWNRDHTLRTAFKASAVPVYQDIARKIGPERMQEYVDKFDYGNRDIGGAPIDMFWLDGALRISAFQQIASCTSSIAARFRSRSRTRRSCATSCISSKPSSVRCAARPAPSASVSPPEPRPRSAGWSAGSSTPPRLTSLP